MAHHPNIVIGKAYIERAAARSEAFAAKQERKRKKSLARYYEKKREAKESNDTKGI